ncbi:hypothetical protein HDU99_008096 [Rhizoclosmatium hyalinum]|nr:hypothetical protein HDU99_008096 [Rhizoclosmatium hyalinum]
MSETTSPTSGADKDKEKEKHLLALKVMRLSRPSLSVSASTVDAPLTGTLSAAAAAAESATSTSALLSLPPSFGAIFLGESFDALLVVVNEDLNKTIQKPAIRAELQTQTQRFTLADTVSNLNDSPNTTALQPLAPSKSHQFLISHEIKELGIHILVCTVSYSSPINGELKSFRKFFKFNVLNPLSVKTKVNSLADGRVFLEAQVQNVSGMPMYLEKMHFEANDLFVSSDMSLEFQEHPAAPKSSVFSDTAVLSDKDSRQYLYTLHPKTRNDPITKQTPQLGKLDIQWRTTLGQQGRLQTSQLSRKITPSEPIRVELVSLKGPVIAERPFRATCRLSNYLGNDLDASIVFVKGKMSSVLLVGDSERKVGVVAGEGGFVDFEVDFFPLLSGVQKVTGMKVVDGKSGVGYDIDVLCEVVVQ